MTTHTTRHNLMRGMRKERGAIDLASILVGVLVMGVLGAVIAASVFVVIPWSQDAAAKASLDGVKTAQSVSQVKDGKFVLFPKNGKPWTGKLIGASTVTTTTAPAQ